MVVLVAPPPVGSEAVALTAAIFEGTAASWSLPTGALLAALVLSLALPVVASVWRWRRKPAERVLILGGGPLADHLVAAIESRPFRRQSVLGIVDDRAVPDAACPRPGALRDLEQIVARVRPDRVIVALASRRGQLPFKTLLSLRLNGMAVEDGVEYYERLTGKVPIEALTPTSLIFGKDCRPRWTDVATTWLVSKPMAVAGLVLLAPLLVLIALAIKLDSPGPIFFVQPRVGRGGRRFQLIKFRTMRPATGATSEWARDNHCRLTRVGRWLRQFRLDELPQFLNVVIGDMNLVGPRPHPVTNLPLLVLVARNTPECGEQIPFYALRSLVRPGITGWAQVRYQYANDLEEEIEKMRYDLYYIKHRSLWLDLRIILSTLKIVVRGRESGLPMPARPLAAKVRPGQAPLRLADAADPLGPSSLPMGTMPIAGADGRRAAQA